MWKSIHGVYFEQWCEHYNSICLVTIISCVHLTWKWSSCHEFQVILCTLLHYWRYFYNYRKPVGQELSYRNWFTRSILFICIHCLSYSSARRFYNLNYINENERDLQHKKIPSLTIAILSMFDVNTSSYFMVVAYLLIFFVVLYPWINIINFFSILLLCDVYTIYVVLSYNSRTSPFKSDSY